MNKTKSTLYALLWVIVLVHLSKDITQDLLGLKTTLDMLGNVQEDLTWLPPRFQMLYLYFFGGLSVVAELILLFSIPFVLFGLADSEILKLTKVSASYLFGFFGLAILLDTTYSGFLKQTLANTSLVNNVFWSIFGGFLGALIALWLDKFKLPKLEITCTDDAHSDNKYPEGQPRPFSRAKFFRIRVTNKNLPKFAGYFLTRSAAEQVSAKLTISKLKKTMKGRWATTLELAYANLEDKLRLAQFPETETIAPGESVLLDVYMKPSESYAAYGWNNEAYLHNWRTPDYEMRPGNYKINVSVSMINGKTKVSTLEATVSKTLEHCKLSILKD